MRGTVFGERYVIDEPRGQSGSRSAFSGRDTATGARVVITLIPSQPSRSGDFRKDVKKAVEALSHPGIARLLHLDVAGDGRFVHVQELVDPPTLADEFSRGAVGSERLARIGEALFGVLAAAHAANVFHGGLTASTIFVTTTAPGLKLVDFGFAEASRSAALDETVDAALDASVDLAAVGKLLSELLTDAHGHTDAGDLSRCLLACQVQDPSTRLNARELAKLFGEVADDLGANPLIQESTGSLSRIVRDVAHAPHDAMGSAMVHATRVGGVPLTSDRFDVKRKLGQGGFGVVYEAFDKTRDSIVALKALERFDGDRLYRFKKEFRALSGIVHPNLVRLHELFAIDGAWFFTMEIVHGRDFVSFVRSAAASTGAAGVLRSCLRQLVDGIAAIHAAGRLHRDLKPHNVLVTESGEVKILDFGLVAELAPDDKQTAEAAGTPAYIAPETIGNESPTTATDWYSFGAMLYEALTGSIPFAHARASNILVEKLIGEPPPARSLTPSAPADLDALASALLRRDPAARPNLDAIRAVTHVAASVPSAVASSAGDAFVGRVEQLDTMRRAFADSRTAPVVLVIEGESGIGKTALARRVLGEVRDFDAAAVLTGRCYEREAVPFKAFDGVIDSLSRYLRSLAAAEAASVFPRRRDAAMLARLFPVLERVPAWPISSTDDATVVDPQELRSRAFIALRELFTRLADRGPVAVFIDDIQWADADSKALLEALLQPPQPPLLLLCTARPGSAPIARELRRILLAGLAPDDVTALAASLGVSGSMKAQHAAIEARGHPLFVHELLLSGDGAQAVRLDDVLWARIAQLPTQQRSVLDLTSLAGTLVPVNVLADAAGLSSSIVTDEAAVLGAARLLRTGDVVGSFEPYHDRIRELVVARVEDPAHKHRQLAHAFERAGAAERDPQVLVRHFEAAGEPRRAAVHAEHAAELAHGALAFDQAVALFQTALRLGSPAADDASRLQGRLAFALEHAGRGAEAADAYLAAAEGTDESTRLTMLAKASVQLIGSGHASRGHEVLRGVLVALGEPQPTTQRAAVLRLLWERARLRVRGHGYVERPRAELDGRTLLRLQLNDDLCFVVAATDTICGVVLQTRAFRQALDAGDGEFIAQAMAHESFAVALAGPSKAATALALLDRAVRIVPNPNARFRANFTYNGGLLSLFAGHPRAAAEKFAIAETIYREETTGTIWQLDAARLMRLMAHRVRGTLGEICRSYDGYLSDAVRRGDHFMECALTCLSSVRWLADDDVANARQALARARELSAGQAYNLQQLLALVSRADIGLYADDTEMTLELVNGEREQVKRSFLLEIYIMRVEYYGALGRLALAEAVRTGDQHHVEVARSMARRVAREPSPYGTARALLLDAGVCNQRDAPAEAVALLRRVTALADTEGMLGISAVARRRTGVLVGSDEGRALVASADADLRAECVRVPERIVDVYAPGLAPR